MATAVYSSFKQICNANGVPVSGALIYIYDVGTTTLKTVYSDPDLDSSHEAANPIVCDGYGRHAMRYIATGAYKAWEKTAAGASVRDAQDYIDGGIPVGAGALAIANGGTGATTAEAALSNLGAADASGLADVAADVASLAGAASSSEKTHLATGTTAQRPATPAEGDVRRNTTTSEWEGSPDGATWENFKTSADATATADVTAETAEDTYLRPDRLKYSDRVSKAWARVNVSGGTPTIDNGFGFSGITDNGTGDYSLTFSVTQPNANYAASATAGNSDNIAYIKSTSTTVVRVGISARGTGSATDPDMVSVFVFGDFA